MNKGKPKIAIFHCGFIYSGGGERIVLEEARGLIRRGYEVEIFAPTLDKKRCYPEMIEELNIKTFLPSYVDSLPGKYALRMAASSLLAPLFAINFRTTDIFIGANQPGAWIAYCVAKVLRKPYIVYFNQPNRTVYPRPIDIKYGWTATVKDYQFLFKLIYRVLRPLISWLDKTSVQHSNQLLVNGRYIGDIIENIYSIKAVNTPAGAKIYAPSLLYTNPHTAYSGTIRIGQKIIRKPYALITNRHDPQKRFDYVIRAMQKVLKKYPKAVLAIPGPFTDHTKFLKKMVKKFDMEDNVVFLGTVSEKDLQKLYRHAAVYCYPSPEEDFGLGPLEAGGWGVPTVAWKHGGPTVTVEDGVTGFLAKPYDVDDYADKMLRLFKNQKLRSKMGKAAWQRTRDKFSWDKHVDTIENTFVDLI